MQTVRELANHMVETVTLPGSETELILVHKDFKVEDLEKYLDDPVRIRENVAIGDMESLIAYTERFKVNSETLGFALPDRIGAVLDYHNTEHKPSWGTHVVQYAYEETPEWKDWMAKNEQPFGQLDLGEFIEDHMDNIVEPKAAKLLEVVTQFQELRSANLTSAVNIQNGMVKLTFLEDNKAGEVLLPSEIKLGIAPFKHGPTYEIRAKVRYRVQGPQVRIWYKLNRPDKVKDDAIESFRKDYAEKTGISVLRSPKLARFIG
jgi:uncharacterized protein YfdQ (DUF2303 family)